MDLQERTKRLEAHVAALRGLVRELVPIVDWAATRAEQYDVNLGIYIDDIRPKVNQVLDDTDPSRVEQRRLGEGWGG